MVKAGDWGGQVVYPPWRPTYQVERMLCDVYGTIILVDLMSEFSWPSSSLWVLAGEVLLSEHPEP